MHKYLFPPRAETAVILSPGFKATVSDRFLCDIIELIRGLSIGKTYNGEFKPDVDLAALIGELTVAEISRRYNVHESVVRRWRREGLEHIRDGCNAKNSSNKTEGCNSEEKIAMLERKVGQLTLDNDFLKEILGVSEKERFMMVEKNGKIAVRRQCMLLNLNRSKIYYCNKKPNKEELQLTASIDGKGRWADNVYIERLWRAIKCEPALLERFKHINDVKKHIQQFVYFYNFKRLHQNLNYNTPNNVYNKILDGHSFI